MAGIIINKFHGSSLSGFQKVETSRRTGATHVSACTHIQTLCTNIQNRSDAHLKGDRI